MDNLRLEETVYAIQKTRTNKLKTTEAKINGTNNDSETHLEGRNSEVICQIGKRMSYSLGHGSCYEHIQRDNQEYVSMAVLLQ